MTLPSPDDREAVASELRRIHRDYAKKDTENYHCIHTSGLQADFIASLVRAAVEREREECAKVCASVLSDSAMNNRITAAFGKPWCDDIAQRIRARRSPS